MTLISSRSGSLNRAPTIGQGVSAEILVMIEPDAKQQGKADREGAKAAHDFRQFVECLRHLERNHQQGYREGENRVAQAFDPRYFLAAPTKRRAVS